jgi:hypothetical protein
VGLAGGIIYLNGAGVSAEEAEAGEESGSHPNIAPQGHYDSDVRHIDRMPVLRPGELGYHRVRLLNLGPTPWLGLQLCRTGGPHDDPAVRSARCIPLPETSARDSVDVVLQITAPDRSGDFEMRYRIEDAENRPILPRDDLRLWVAVHVRKR